MSEVRERFGLAGQALQALQRVLARHPQVQRAAVYGSRAKGTHRNGSDIDLTLFGESLTQQELLSIEREIDDLDLPYKVDLSIYAQIEDPAVRAHIDRVGRPIYPVAGAIAG